MMRYEARDYGEVWCINQELRSASGDLTITASPGELVEIFCKKFQSSRSTRISIPWLFYNVHWMERMGYYQYFPAGAGWVQYSTMQTALSDYKSRRLTVRTILIHRKQMHWDRNLPCLERGRDLYWHCTALSKTNLHMTADRVCILPHTC